VCIAALALLTLISHHWPFQHRDDFEAPISSEDLIIRDLTVMYLVMGMKYAGKINSACHDIHIAIIKFKTISWEKINGGPQLNHTRHTRDPSCYSGHSSTRLRQLSSALLYFKIWHLLLM